MTSPRSMIRLGVAVILALFALAAIVVARPVAAQAQAEPQLLFAFQGQVNNGPSAGTVLSGDLGLNAASDGTLSGALTIGDTAIPVTGRLAGTNISVTFDLGGGVYIFGIGRLGPSGNFRGPFVGPQSGDLGNWVAKPVTVAAFDFEGTVNQGPSQGTELAGVLTLRIIGSHFTGGLALDANTTIPVRGRLITSDDETRINVTFDLGNGVRIRGTGVAAADGSFSGPFRGPAAGDRGTWVATPR